MEPNMGDRENWTNGKVWKTESMENLCHQFSECRKVTTHKMFKRSHTLMLKESLGSVMGKTEPTENLENWINGKFVSPVFWVQKGHHAKMF